MPKTFFISDLHIGHKNILQYDSRPYFTVDECAEDLVRRWNNKVTPTDRVVVVGDFFWTPEYAKKYLPQLNGEIIVIEGNHDCRWTNYRWMKNYYQHMGGYKIVPYFHEKILVNGELTWVYASHQYIPFYLHQYDNGTHIYGHSHTTKECFDEWDIQDLLRHKGYPQRCYNVGCMHSYMNYEPKTIEELEEAREKGLIECYTI